MPATAKRDWTKRPASKSQIARINRLEHFLGLAISTPAVIGTAGAASKLYQSLKADANEMAA